MSTKAFSIEDGTLGSSPITSTSARRYKDIDLTFQRKPSGDIYKKEDAAAIKQAVKNLLLTNFNEKPFDPFYGGDLYRYLFELSDGMDDIEIKEQIYSVISAYEPRAKILDLQTEMKPDFNSVGITIVFQVLNITDTVKLDISITRLR